jgi:hypothetical protein
MLNIETKLNANKQNLKVYPVLAQFYHWCVEISWGFEALSFLNFEPHSAGMQSRAFSR